jgi:hypothetical protein
MSQIHPSEQDFGRRILALHRVLQFHEQWQPCLDLMHWLARSGVNIANVLNIVGPIAELAVKIQGQRFRFCNANTGDKILAVVHVAVGPDGETPIDLVAWQRQKPHRIVQAVGAIEALSVEQILNPASWFAGRPLFVHRTPLGWLRGGCQGIVILDPDGVRCRLQKLPVRSGGYDLAAESPEHGRELRRCLSPLPEGLRILVRNPVEQRVST